MTEEAKDQASEVADAKQLEQLALATDAELENPEAAAPGAPQLNVIQESNADSVAHVLEIAGELLRPVFPTVAAMYSPDTCRQVGEAVGGVLDKYGKRVTVGKWKAEIHCATVVIPLAIATYQAVQIDLGRLELPQPEEGGEGGQTTISE